jgi:threonine/homoserine/homoserine lactone efflux protein
MDLPRLLAFGAVALLVIVIPGPSVLFIVSRTVSLGRRAALGTVVGNSLGEFLQVLVVSLGLGQLLERSALAFTVVKLLGAAYLLYLGVQAWRVRRSVAAELAATFAPRRRRRIVWDGLVVGLTNPKSMVFFAAVLPEFVDRSLGHTSLQLLLLGLVWVALALISDSTWALAAGTARNWLARRPRQLERAQGASAVVMIGLGVGLAVTSRAG